MLGEVGQAEIACDCQRLRGKGFVQFHHIHLCHRQAGLGQHLAHRRHRPHPHDARRNTASSHGHHPGTRLQTMTRCGLFTGQNGSTGAIVHARGIAGGDRATLARHRLEPAQLLQRGVRTWMLVGIEHRHRTLLAGQLDGDDFIAEKTGRLSTRPALLAGQGKGILIGARHLPFLGYVFGCIGHGINTEGGFHLWIHEAPADGGVLDFRHPRESALGLGHHQRSAGHALHATGDQQIGFAAANGARCLPHRLQAGGTQAVHRHPRHARRQAGQQQRHARHVAVVLAGLIDATVEHILQRRPVDPGIARHQRLEWQGRQVIGAHTGQGTGITADRGTDCIADKSMGHDGDTEEERKKYCAPHTAAARRWCNGTTPSRSISQPLRMT